MKRDISPQLAIASFVIGIVWVLLPISFGSEEHAAAQGDITAPVLVDLKLEPDRVDTSNGSQAITVTATFTDNLSGFHDAFIIFAPEMGTTQSHSVEFGHIWNPEREEGLLTGVYTDTLTLPQHAAQGWWIIQQLSLVDMVGNRKDYFINSSDGFPEELQAYRFYNGPGVIAPTPPLTYTTYLASILNSVVSTPTPTIPVILQSNGVTILDNYSLQIDEEQNQVRFLGEVQNNTDEEVQKPRIIYGFYNATDELLASGEALIQKSLLPSGTKTCFLFGTDSQVINDAAYLTITVDFRPSGGNFSPLLTIFDHSAVYHEETQSYDIAGRIRNDGMTERRFLQIIGTLYDLNGGVMQCETHYFDIFVLPPGVIGLWRLSFPNVDPTQVGGYRVEGN
jgi:hypothetical protein